MFRTWCVWLFVIGAAGLCSAQDTFINWETPHVHPLELTPDGSVLLAVNTADNRLEVFDVSSGTPALLQSIPVGLDPVTVRARSNTEAWVVNHVSDSVSVVDLTAGSVIDTVSTRNEPCDVVFAGTPQRAFISCSEAEVAMVFDLVDLTTPVAELDLRGEDPRAMAVSGDGSEVYVAFFESGNGSTVIKRRAVERPFGPFGGQNPIPPQAGDPAENPVNDPPPRVAHIVREDDAGVWRDGYGADWSILVDGAAAGQSDRIQGWDLLDNDMAIIDANALTVDYISRLMNIDMAMAVKPDTGQVTIVGTDSTNEIRFEPVLNGVWLRVVMAVADPSLLQPSAIHDLNPHLDYSATSVAQGVRDMSVGDPRGLVWNSLGSTAWVSGMGSNNVIVLDSSDLAAARPTIEVGAGPTGLALLEGQSRLFVLNKFDASISVVDTGTNAVVDTVTFFDPTPAAIRDGRVHLYGTHETSGLGHMACGSCHVDGRTDRLAWDLGNPAGDMIPFTGNCNDTGCADNHPMKGPMTTQTLQDIIGKEPLHWRGDKEGLADFNGAFTGLLGDDTQLTPGEMQQFSDFLASIWFPPNPYRNFDDTLPTDLPLVDQFATGERVLPFGAQMPNGNALAAVDVFRGLVNNNNCVRCHTMSSGVGPLDTLGGTIPPLGPNGEVHTRVVSNLAGDHGTMKISQLRGLYDKIGTTYSQPESTAGFGFSHDAEFDSISAFVEGFPFENDQQVADATALMLAFGGVDLETPLPNEPVGPPSHESPAAVGTQVTVNGDNQNDTAVTDLLTQVMAMADVNRVGIVAKGLVAGEARGYMYDAVLGYQSDRAAEVVLPDALRLTATNSEPITFTIVPVGSENRIGIDRDEDGAFDRDEIDVCSDPADPTSLPGAGGCVAPPTGLLCDVSGADIQLSWTNGEAYDSVEVEIVHNGGAPTIVVLAGTAISYVDPAVSGGTHDYLVRGVNTTGSAESALCSTQIVPLGLSGVGCSVVGSEIQLSWANGEVYDSIQLTITRNGVPETPIDLGGASTGFTDSIPAVGTNDYELVASLGGVSTAASNCSTQLIPPPASGVTCVAIDNDASVQLTWTNGFAYDQIEVLRDGQIIATLAGAATSHVDTDPGSGSINYVIRTTANGASADTSACTVVIVPPIEYWFRVNDEVCTYNVSTGIGAFNSPLYLEEGAGNPGFPNAIEGFAMGLAYDPDLLQAAGVITGSALQSMNGGSGPWFYSADVTAAGAVTIGAIFSMDGSETMAATGPQEVAIVLFDTNATVLSGDNVGATTALAWADGLGGGTPVDNEVIVGGTSFPAAPDGAVVSLVPAGAITDFIRGDCNSDGNYGLPDALELLNSMFGGGDAVGCALACDANDDDSLGLGDAMYVLNNLFSGGSDPAAPFPSCGADGTPGSLDCGDYTACP